MAVFCTLFLGRERIYRTELFRGLYEDADADRAHIRGTLAALGALLERSATLDGDEIHRQLDTLIALSGEPAFLAPSDLAESEPRVMAAPAPSSLFGQVLAWLAAWLGRSSTRATRRNLHEARALRIEVRAGLAANRRATRELAGKLERRMQRLAVASAHSRDAIARLDSRAQDQRAAIDALADALGPAGEPDAAMLGDARSQMERLRRRLGTRFEEAAAEPAEPIIPTSQRGAI